MPSLMALGAVLLAFGAVVLDRSLEREVVEEVGWVYLGGAEGARSVLSTIGSSIITVAGVTFSITIAVLTLASSQFGPRVIRTFLRDVGNQVVLGTFVGTFLYCLLVLRTVRGSESGDFVPHISVTVGVLLAVLSLGVLIYFIHHIATSIQADHIVAALGDDLQSAVADLRSGQAGEVRGSAAPAEPSIPPDSTPKYPIRATESGYLQSVDTERLTAIGAERDLLIKVEQRPGRFILPGAVLASAGPAERVSKEVTGPICSAFILGDQRTPVQDLEFAIMQLVEVAVRALSRSVNDPFTAIACVDRLGAALCRFLDQPPAEPLHHDQDGQVRVILPPVTTEEVFGSAFDQIRQYGHSSVAVMIRLLETLAGIVPWAHRSPDRAVILRHAQMVVNGSRSAVPGERELADIENAFRRVVRALEASSHPV